MEQAIVLLSGGVDSAVALWWAKARGWDVHPLTFEYFGRPKKEDEAMQALVARAGVRPVRHVALPFLQEIDDLRKERAIGNARLLESPEGYIPARNLIFYSLAAYHAEIDGIRYIVGGHNGTDPEAFPDAGPRFFESLNRILRRSLWSSKTTPVEAVIPLSGKSKADVVRMGVAMGVPFGVTWSCYWNRPVHCGTCQSCRERKEAFAAAGAADPASYEA